MPIMIGVLIILAIALALPVGILGSVAWIERRQARQNDGEDRDEPLHEEFHSKAIVIYFSRSGNTALVARHMARRLGAPLVGIRASDYRLGFFGLIRALRDARGSKSLITPETLDLRSFDTVYLGSPVWLYSPAPPIWTFI